MEKLKFVIAIALGIYCPGVIIRVQYSGRRWGLSGGITQGKNFPGWEYSGGNCPGGSFPGGSCPGVIVRGAIFQGGTVLEPYVTCFAKIFLLMLFHNTHQVRWYHFFIVEIIVDRVNLIQKSK